MTEATETASQRDRSPAFPVVPLETALARLAEFEAHYKRNAARPEKVGEAWDIKAKGYADRIAAALRYFGLLEYQGSGKDRSIILSEEGRKYLRSHQEQIKQEVIKAAALRPKQLAKFWTAWGADRPADPACLDELIQKHGFSDGGARDFLKVYDATTSFAKLSDSDKISNAPRASDKEQEQDLPAMEPQRQVKQTSVHERAELRATADATVIRRAVFTLDEGDVVIEFPRDLSKASVDDLAHYLDTFMKRARREARPKDEKEPNNEAAN